MKLVIVLAISSLSWAQAPASLKHFEEIDKNVYVGSKPRSDKDFEFLQSKHVHYILNAHFLPGLSGAEKRKAKRYGMEFVAIPMNASFIPPQRQHVDKILLTMHNPESQPIYLHCVLGRDRTSLVSGLYKIHFLGVSKAEAWKQMRAANFKTWFFLRGLKSYFDKNADRPITPAIMSAPVINH